MSETSPQASQAGSGKLRQFVLLGILFVLVIALLYDYRVARPSVEQAYDKIAEQSILVNRSSTEVFTNENVQELIGKQPSRTFEEPNGDLVEVYSWRSGLPIRTHDLFAVYKQNGGKWMFHRHAKFQHEASTDVSQHDVKGGSVVASPIDVSELEDMEEGPDEGGPSEGGGGFGGGGSGYAGSSAYQPGAGGPGGGRQFDPEAMFNESDQDGDGKLTGPEIPERARASLSEIDTDGDESISKEEWTARMEAMRARFGRGPGGGGPSGQTESSRPELESEPEATEAEGEEQPESAAPEASEEEATPQEDDAETPAQPE